LRRRLAGNLSLQSEKRRFLTVLYRRGIIYIVLLAL